MKGSLTKYKVTGTRSIRWRYRIYIGLDAKGRKVYEGRGGFERQRDAATAMRAHMTALEASTTGRASYTLSSWLTYWIDTYAPLRCKSLVTVERYRRLSKYLHGPSASLRRLASLPLALLTHIDLEPALASLVNARGVRRRISAKTVRHFGNLINVALKKAVLLEYIPANPMLKVELPVVQKRNIRSLTPEEIQALRTVCQRDWTFALVELALATGCRRGELLALVWRDIDFPRRLALISKSVEQTAAGLRIKNTKSERPRLCTLPKVAMDALEHLRQKQLARSIYSARGYIFCNHSGEILRPDLISQIIVRRLRRAGICDASLHTLRHSHASNLLSNGVPLPAVSARLGHADPQVTARIYSHALPGDDERAAKAWDELIGDVQKNDAHEAGEWAEIDEESDSE
jgi:integrase